MVRTLRIGFVMEQTLGHVTHHRNLARWAAEDPSVHATWIAVPCWQDDRWARWPVVRNNPSLSLSLRARDRLRYGHDRSSFDALFYHTQSTALFSLGLARRLPVVVSLDATPLNIDSIASGYGHRPDSRSTLGGWKLRWYRRLFHVATALTTWSRWARDSLVRDYGVDPDKVEVIPPGIDLGAWSTSRDRTDSGSPVRVLFVGGQFARKGGGVLLEAFEEGLSGRCELDLVTADEVPGAGDRVRVHRGLRHDDPALRRLFAEADLFVLPTLADCSPLVILEAMASGLAVVATDVGAISEQVTDGETGLLVPPGDAAALGRAVLALVDDPLRRRAFGSAGLRRARERFDGARNYRALTDLLKRSIANYARPRWACHAGVARLGDPS
jgi:glycosyltransferase involved in cell wall biosynthesis